MRFVADPRYHLWLHLAMVVACAGAPEPFDSSPEGEMVLIPTGVTWVDDVVLYWPDREPAIGSGWAPVEAFFIDTTEVTVGEYRRCVEDDDAPCSTPFDDPGCLYWSADDVDEYPMNCIPRKEAIDYCAWLNPGGRLPTVYEWVRAARGDDNRPYPWGEALPKCLYTVSACDSDEGAYPLLAPVGTKPMGTSVFGVHDMIGNVAEWIWDSDTYESAGDVHGFMGGYMLHPIPSFSGLEATYIDRIGGFRCALLVKQ